MKAEHQNPRGKTLQTSSGDNVVIIDVIATATVREKTASREIPVWACDHEEE